jgi:hypothetical protein
MAKLPKSYLRNQGRFFEPFSSSWRSSPSVIGRGDTRCGICQAVFDRDDDTEMFEGERCHSECVEAEEQGS